MYFGLSTGFFNPYSAVLTGKFQLEREEKSLSQEPYE
jgi:hypothetical protein